MKFWDFIDKHIMLIWLTGFTTIVAYILFHKFLGIGFMSAIQSWIEFGLYILSYPLIKIDCSSTKEERK